MNTRARSVAGLGAIATLAASLGLLGASAANAGTSGPAFWVHTPSDPTDSLTVSVPAGGDFFVTGPASDNSGLTDPTYVVTFETPAPPPPTGGGGIGSGGDPGTAGGTPVVTKTIPDTGAAWSVQVTVPATTAPGNGYNVCVKVQATDGFGDLGCASVTVLPAVTDSTTPTATPTPSTSSTPETAGTQPAPAVTVDHASVIRGGTLSFTGSGFTPGEKVSVIAHSTPVVLGTVTASATGAVAGSVKVPATLPMGAHTLELRGATSGTVVSASFTVGSVPSAATDMLPRSSSHDSVPGVAVLVLLAAATLGGLALRRHRATT